MTDPVTIVLPGDPVAFARTRTNSSGTRFNPKKQQRYAFAARWQAIIAMGSRPPFDCAVRMDLEAQFGIAASWPQKKKDAALVGDIRPVKVPDLTNIAKIIEDAFNHIIYKDDAQIVEYGVLRKVYSTTPQVIITVQPVAAPTLAEMVRGLPNDSFDDMIDAEAGR